jgi:hypothetical protein
MMSATRVREKGEKGERMAPQPYALAREEGLAVWFLNALLNHPVEVVTELLRVLHHTGDVMPDQRLQPIRAVRLPVRARAVVVTDIDPRADVIMILLW